MKLVALLLGAGLLATACSSTTVGDVTTSIVTPAPTTSMGPSTTSEPTPPSTFPPSPDAPSGPLDPVVEDAIERLLAGIYTEAWDLDAIGDLADLGDIRTAWLLADIMRFYQSGLPSEELTWAFSNLTGAPQDPGEVAFVWATNHLLAWDLPAWDGYHQAKARVFTPVEARWQDFFDESVHVDWRQVTWGGVLADERPLGDNGPCNCIPALDYPDTTDAADGVWYPDDAIVFGVVVGDEAIALPKNQMEVHEMVNLTLGGRELGIPYCTLCASAQAYFVDNVPGHDRLVLRTSGLLRRSNKFMYDLTTGSAIDTFTGRALTGPLAEEDVVLEQVSVAAATWADWRLAHPTTRIIAEDGGIGRSYDPDPLGGRDDRGPIFPIGQVDSRLPIQEHVIGVITADGTPVAFPVNAIRAELAGGEVEYLGLAIRLEDGIRVYDEAGDELVSHQAFWFAWSQFHPRTVVWAPVGS